jgi:hypothetical protein
MGPEHSTRRSAAQRRDRTAALVLYCTTTAVRDFDEQLASEAAPTTGFQCSVDLQHSTAHCSQQHQHQQQQPASQQRWIINLGLRCRATTAEPVLGEPGFKDPPPSPHFRSSPAGNVTVLHLFVLPSAVSRCRYAAPSPPPGPPATTRRAARRRRGEQQAAGCMISSGVLHQHLNAKWSNIQGRKLGGKRSPLLLLYLASYVREIHENSALWALLQHEPLSAGCEKNLMPLGGWEREGGSPGKGCGLRHSTA